MHIERLRLQKQKSGKSLTELAVTSDRKKLPEDDEINEDTLKFQATLIQRSKRMQSKQNNTDYIVGMYVRLSRDDERAGASLSIENQKAILSDYIAEQGWTLYDIYVDDGISGTTFDRPGVKRLLDDAKQGVINTILVKDYCAIIGLNQKDLENQGILA